MEKSMEYSEEKMKKFAKRDALIRFMISDLTIRLGDESRACRVVYNSEVLEDSIMMEEYKNLDI